MMATAYMHARACILALTPTEYIVYVGVRTVIHNL